MGHDTMSGRDWLICTKVWDEFRVSQRLSVSPRMHGSRLETIIMRGGGVSLSQERLGWRRVTRLWEGRRLPRLLCGVTKAGWMHAWMAGRMDGLADGWVQEEASLLSRTPSPEGGYWPRSSLAAFASCAGLGGLPEALPRDARTWFLLGFQERGGKEVEEHGDVMRHGGDTPGAEVANEVPEQEWGGWPGDANQSLHMPSGGQKESCPCPFLSRGLVRSRRARCHPDEVYVAPSLESGVASFVL